jgi:hypothetical protein
MNARKVKKILISQPKPASDKSPYFDLAEKYHLTLNFYPFIVVERGREFFFEGQRRTDLIRFNKFTGSSYVWTWKGNVKEGRSVADHFKVYPIPADDIGANENLVQNTGY